MVFGREDFMSKMRHNLVSDAHKVLVYEYNSSQDVVAGPLPLLRPLVFCATHDSRDELVSDPRSIYINPTTVFTYIGTSALLQDPTLHSLFPKHKIPLPYLTDPSLNQHAHTVFYSPSSDAKDLIVWLESIKEQNPAIAISYVLASEHHDNPPAKAFTLHMNIPLDVGLALLDTSFPFAQMVLVGSHTIHIITPGPEDPLPPLQHIQAKAFSKIGTHLFQGVVVGEFYHSLHTDAPHKQRASTSGDKAAGGCGFISGLRPGFQLSLLRQVISHFTGRSQQDLPKTTWLRVVFRTCLLRIDAEITNSGAIVHRNITIQPVSSLDSFTELDFDPLELEAKGLAPAPAVQSGSYKVVITPAASLYTSLLDDERAASRRDVAKGA
jgi:hypothetical protein